MKRKNIATSTYCNKCHILFGSNQEILNRRVSASDRWLVPPREHTTLLKLDFFANNSITTLHQLVFSPELAPCDLWLFLKLNNRRKDCGFRRYQEDQGSNAGTAGQHPWRKRFPDVFQNSGNTGRRSVMVFAPQGKYLKGVLNRL